LENIPSAAVQCNTGAGKWKGQKIIKKPKRKNRKKVRCLRTRNLYKVQRKGEKAWATGRDKKRKVDRKPPVGGRKTGGGGIPQKMKEGHWKKKMEVED